MANLEYNNDDEWYESENDIREWLQGRLRDEMSHADEGYAGIDGEIA